MGSKNVTRAIEPLALFHRICILSHTETSLKTTSNLNYHYTLCHYSVKKACKKQKKKSKLLNFEGMWYPYIIKRQICDWCSFRLHCVLWTRGKTFNETTTTYVSYIERHFGSNWYIVFYGHEVVGLKSMEHQRRYTKCTPDIIIHANNAITVSRERFLSNLNK